jgi:hypothetical protein
MDVDEGARVVKVTIEHCHWFTIHFLKIQNYLPSSTFGFLI